MTTADGAPAADAGPPATTDPWWWSEVLLLGVLAVVASVAVGALGLACLGWYSLPASLAVAAVPSAAVVTALVRAGPAAQRPRRPLAPLAAGLLVVALAAAFWGRSPSEHVLVDRDPGMYADLAPFVSGTGGLVLDYSDTPFETVRPNKEPATYREDGPRWEFQFGHLLSALGAVVYDIAGPEALFRLPAVLCALGLAAIFLLASRLVRWRWAAVAVALALAASAPSMFVARDMYSESLVIPMLWAGLLGVSMFGPRRSLPGAAVAGWILGTAVAARADTLLAWCVAIPVAVLWIAAGTGADTARRLRFVAVLAAAAVIPVAVGLIDLRYLTGRYGLGEGFRPLLLGTAAVAVASVATALVFRSPGPRQAALRHRRPAALVAGVTVFAVLGLLWLVRPLVQTTRSEDRTTGIVEALQLREGVPVDPAANGFEDSVRWAAWYFGDAFVAVGILALAVIAYRVVAGRASRMETVVGALAVGVGVFYWWAPQITPDHLWATRRYVTIVYPSLALAVALGLDWFDGLLARTGLDRARVLSAGAVVLVCAQSVGPTWPVRWARTQHGVLGAVESVCDHVGEAAVVSTSQTAAHAIRSWCGVPTLPVIEPDPDELGELAAAWAQVGRDLYVVGTSPVALAGVLGAVEEPVELEAVNPSLKAERSLTRPPGAYVVAEPFRFLAARVPPG